MYGYNDDITNDQRNKLQELFPEVFTEDKIDWARLKATLGEAVDLGERYGLSWKGKSDVFATIQEKTVQTLHPDLANSLDIDTTQNMFIEGDNLAALKILHKAYYGKIKMIYIDPPYNTGNDFVYNDDFKQTRRSYEAEAGIVDEEGNITRDDGLRPNTGGHKHSNWLNMMYPRLFLARNLLRQDGVIFVSIDDNEVHNLRLMMNEIFGEENFVAQVVWERAYAPVNLKHHFSESHDYIICFARNAEQLGKLSLGRSSEADARYKNPDNDPRGPYKADNFSVGPANPKNIYEIITPSGRRVLPPSGYSWRFSEEKTRELIADNRVWFGKDGNNVPAYKRFLSEVKDGVTPMTVWKYTDVGHSQDATKEVKDLFEGVAYFDYPKPTKLIKRLAELCASDNDIILDFFSGSGTTAHAVAELNAEDGGNRQWICVQLPELTDEKSEAFKAGYRTIADIARERIRRANDKICTDFTDKLADRESPIDFGFRAYRVGDSNFKQWNELVSGAEEIRQQTLDAIDPLEPGATDDDLLVELLLKRGISPLVPVEQHGNFLFIPSKQLAIRLAPDLTETDCADLLGSGASAIIVLSRAFANNETLCANFLLQAEQRGVEVEVV